MNCMGHADKVNINNFSIKILESINIFIIINIIRKKRDMKIMG